MHPVTGGGAAAASMNAPLAGGGRPRRTYTREELSERVDALALSVGSKVTASTVLLASVVVILIGAQSLLATMQGMDRDIKAINEQVAVANGGLAVLNEFMDSVPPTSRHLEAIVGTVDETSTQVKASAAHIDTMVGTTKELSGQLEGISSSTGEMRTSLGAAADDTTTLNTTVGSLNGQLDPLVKTQNDMLQGTRRMRGGLDGMNASLAWVVRVMNYIAAPPTGGGLTIRADLPKETLPPLPGIKAEVEPVGVFPRNVWPVYTADPKTP